VTYYFSSASNKSAFAKSPLSYEPQYGAGVLLPWVIQDKVAIDPILLKY
jgi:hypothetical protein